MAGQLLVSIALTPVILCLEYYVLRYAGVPFQQTGIVLAISNAAALYVGRATFRGLRWPDWRLTITIALVILVPVVAMLPQFLNTSRVYFGNPWLYGDVTYLVARGDLILEDPELAGIGFAIPSGAGSSTRRCSVTH
ncbi:MAG: hypothetical protein WKF37_08155 [Bryobacteraceae bacterium]